MMLLIMKSRARMTQLKQALLYIELLLRVRLLLDRRGAAACMLDVFIMGNVMIRPGEAFVRNVP